MSTGTVDALLKLVAFMFILLLTNSTAYYMCWLFEWSFSYMGPVVLVLNLMIYYVVRRLRK